jgi:hypothetical protein
MPWFGRFTGPLLAALALLTLPGPPVPAAAAPHTPAVASALPAAPEHPTGPTRINDVDGDGRVDVVGLDVGSEESGRPGGVRVLFASGKSQTITRAQLGDPPMEDTMFGEGFTVADLNFDGYADILVSDWTMADYSGVVWAIWGSAQGISIDRVSILAKGTAAHPLGTSLAFITEPEPVLAVGVAGAPNDGPYGVMLYRVEPSGRLGAHRYLRMGSPGIASGGNPLAQFATVTASAGDLLVLGAADGGPRDASGTVWVLQLLPGLTYWATRVDQDRWGLPGRSEALDRFGEDISVVDDVVVVSVPGETVHGTKLKGAVQSLRVERTGHGLRIHPGRLITALDSGQKTVLDATRRGTEVMVGVLCPNTYGVVINAGPVAVPLEKGSNCSPQLPSGTAFTLLRDGKGVDRPAVLQESTFTIGTPPDASQLETGSDSHTWLATEAVFAEPAA